MGGDGGVIASNRRYMRGAGFADHTGDAKRSQQDEKTSRNEAVQELMTVCYLTKNPLQFGALQIVACPYGRLYHKEAAVEALLRRKQGTDELGSHIRGLKDLMDARFVVEGQKPVCPVTGVELNGINAALLISTKKDDTNVISERALKEVGREALQSEYGDLDNDNDLVRLAPSPSKMDEIKEKVQSLHDLQAAQKSSSKKRKKDKKKDKDKKDGKKSKKQNKDEENDESGRPRKQSKVDSSNVADAARTRVESAVKSSGVLSSLFATKKAVSTKERNDDLFARY